MSLIVHNDGPCFRCSECVGGPHHFGDCYIGSSTEEPDHPAAQAGEPFWYICKHCPAWITVEDYMSEFEGIEIEASA
jgi:hypothetical protein